MNTKGLGPQVVILAIVVLLIFGLSKIQPKPSALGQNIGKQVSLLTQR